jgi:hypothetical protein
MREPARVEAGRPSAGIVGECDAALQGVLREVLAELGATCEDQSPPIPPDLVFAIVSSEDATAVLTAARLLASGRPIVAILPMRDEALAELAILFGASASYALDTPLDRLRAIVEALVSPNGGAAV